MFIFKMKLARTLKVLSNKSYLAMIKAECMEFIYTSEICLLDPESVLAGSIPIQQEIESNLLPQKLCDLGEISFF